MTELIMDTVDKTKDFNEDAISRFLRQPKPVVQRGKCLYCEAALEPIKVYCNSECRELHEREQSIHRKTYASRG